MLREVRSKTVSISNYSLQVRALREVRSRVPSIRCSGTRERRCSVTRDSRGFHVDHLKISMCRRGLPVLRRACLTEFEGAIRWATGNFQRQCCFARAALAVLPGERA